MARSRDDAFREIEAFLRAGVAALRQEPSVVRRISDGFELADQDVECTWSEEAHDGAPGWNVSIYYAELDYVTDQAQFVGPEVVQTFAAGEEHAVAKYTLLVMVGNWLESAMSEV